jgi:surface antigen
VVYQSPPRDSDCLQTREYTTTVNIGGRPVQAWGTRCLRPDGTWSYGPFQTAPEE